MPNEPSLTKAQPVKEELLPLEEVHTPDCKTIAQLAGFLGIPQNRTAKAVFYVAENETKDFIFCLDPGRFAGQRSEAGQSLSGVRYRAATGRRNYGRRPPCPATARPLA